MISALISRLVILVCATLYPAYCSYKAVKTKDIKLYVKWMMYWIVFALFTSIETFTDMFVSFWCPFYYEFKILFVLWLLLPIFKGSNYLYRKVVHPYLLQKEQDIDEMIAKAKEQGCSVLMDIGSKGVTLATNVIMNTAVKGGSGLLFQLKKSYSLNDLITADVTDDTVVKRRNTKRKEDCKSNFQNVEVNETKRISVERELDLRLPEEDPYSYLQDTVPRSRKATSETVALEEDCNYVTSSFKPRRSNRQAARHMELISTNPTYSYYPFISSQNYAFPPYLYYSSPAKTSNYPLPSPTLYNFNDSDICENFLKMKISTESRSQQDIKKANSSPNISILEPSSNWIFIDSNQSSIGPKKKPRRKRNNAPKPPNVNVPSISINSSNVEQNTSNERFRSLVNDVDYLAPYNLRSRSKQKSKIHQFLSKSRELVSHWKNDNDDTYSVRSEIIDGSSDDSVSTTSSYNTMN